MLLLCALIPFGGAVLYAQSAPAPVRILTWNIHHGFTPSESYQFAAQVRAMVDSGADVLCLQEVQTWDENQPARLKQLLEQLTGRTWTIVWAPVNDNGGTEGNVVATRLPVVDSGTFRMHATSDYNALLANRSAARARISIGGSSFDVVSTHLDYGNTSYRTTQLSQMMAWARTLTAPRIVAGDFNSWWGETWIDRMRQEYADTWERVTGNRDGGYSIGNVRFDYLFQSLAGSALTPRTISVIASPLSDHRPVVADFVVAGGAAPTPTPTPRPNGPTDPRMSVDTPANGATIGSSTTIAGWAVDLGAGSGGGVDAVHVWAYPNPGSGRAAQFLGAARVGLSRPDVGAAFGNAQFAASGFSLTIDGLRSGTYDIVAFAHSAVANAFTRNQVVRVTVPDVSTPPANALMAIDLPSNNANVARSFVVAGWAIDLGAATGTGVDTLHVWAYPNPGSGTPAFFVGAVQYGFTRADVAAAFGRPQAAPSGYTLTVSSLAPGVYDLVVFAHSSVANAFTRAQTVRVTVR